MAEEVFDSAAVLCFFCKPLTPLTYILHCTGAVFCVKIFTSKGGIYLTRKEKITKGIRHSVCAFLIAVLMVSVALMPVGASSERYGEQRVVGSISENGGKISYTLAGMPSSKNIWSYSQYKLKVNGKSLADNALLINGATYLPLRAFFESLGNATVSYNKTTRTAVATLPGLVLSVTDGGYVTYANGRPLFSFTPAVLMSNGKMYVPQLALLKAVGMREPVKSGSSLSYSGAFKPLAHASSFYREDEVLWLSKIISAESRGEPLIGQIAVGNVIMNRVKSSLFPNTIWGVIFDRRYGVQFSPILDGSIYQDPTYNATLSAKICLEGTSLSEDTLYFLAPRYASSNWIVKNREYAYTILNHDFYK